MDKIRLKGISCQARVGVYEWERQQGCRCEIDLEIALDLSRPGRTDKLRDTLDYSALHREVAGLAESCRFNLLERLAEDIARLVLEKPGVKQVRVLLKKKEVIGGGPLEYAAVDIVRCNVD